MKILGLTWNELLIAAMLGITLVLFMKLPISSTVDATLEESIFGRSEHLKERNAKVKQESDWKKYYGSCPELKEDIIKYGKQNFSRRTIIELS